MEGAMIWRKIPIIFSILIACMLSLVPAALANSFIWPVNGEVITPFSQDEHRGIDISARIGEPVMAAQDGVIHWIGKTPAGEPYVSIDHPGGITTTYLPVQASVSKGQTIKAGETVGTLSSEPDKSSAVPHLHFGLFDTATRDDKNYINPLDFLIGKNAISEKKPVL